MNSKRNKISVKTVTLDFWNTMFSSHHNSDEQKQKRWENKFEMYNNLAKSYRHNEFSNIQIEKAIKKEHKVAFDVWKNEQRSMDMSERIKITLEELKLEVSEHDLNRLVDNYNNFIFFIPPIEAEHLSLTLENLTNKGITLAIISDTGYVPGSNIKKFLESRNLLKYFSAFSFSDETGFAKPNKNVFTKIIDDLKISDPSSVMHIGDMEEVDVEGAKSVGFKSCMYTGLSFVNYDSFETNADIHISNWKELNNHLD